MTKSNFVIKSVALFGGADADEHDEENFDAAMKTAQLIAESGRTIINGGGPGIMLAATLGAKMGKGHTQVVYYKPELATMFEGQTAANVADEHFEEANYILRTKRLIELGDTYIVFNGGTGTISEFAMTWGVARLYFGRNKPLILYGKFWHNIIEAFKNNMKIRPEEYKVFKIVTTPQEALEAVEAYETEVKKRRHQNHDNCIGPECKFMLT